MTKLKFQRIKKRIATYMSENQTEITAGMLALEASANVYAYRTYLMLKDAD